MECEVGGINISSYEAGLGKELSNFYPCKLAFNGIIYPSSEAAYQAAKKDLPSLSDENVRSLMVRILKAKLEQYPKIGAEITNRGGSKFLDACTHNLVKNGYVVKTDRWTGKDGLFMQALREAYKTLSDKDLSELPRELVAVWEDGEDTSTFYYAQKDMEAKKGQNNIAKVYLYFSDQAISLTDRKHPWLPQDVEFCYDSTTELCVKDNENIYVFSTIKEGYTEFCFDECVGMTIHWIVVPKLTYHKEQVIYMEKITRTFMQDNPKALFVFGDNFARRGFGGQAKAMRGEANAIGIATKHLPDTSAFAYLSDKDLPRFQAEVDEKLEILLNHLNNGGDVYIPSAGIGTGLAQLESRAPRCWAYLQKAMQTLSEFN